MRYWSGTGLLDLLLLAAALLTARAILRLVPGLRRAAVPEALLAGLAAWVLGPSLLGWLPLDAAVLEGFVYHGLALMFIALGLRRPARGGASAGARSIAFAVPFIAVVQGALGLGIVLAWSGWVERVHPGVGWMLPLGFSQGPGQALSMGTAWEDSSGFAHGGQVGLILAALGYAWCAVVGVGLFHLGRRRGWVVPAESTASPLAAAGPGGRAAPAATAEGDMEPLTMQLVQVGVTYLLVYGALRGLSALLASRPALASMVWGFHFILGLLAALLVRTARDRALLRRWPVPEAVQAQQDLLLSRIAGVVVDLAAVAAIAAVRVELVRSLWPILLVLGLAGGLVTTWLSLWLARRAFPGDPFGHALVLFGMSSGTLPTGLVLLRLADPDLRGEAANDVILGVTGAVVLGAPLLLVVMPMPVLGWPANHPGAVLRTLAVLGLYAALLLVGWRRFGPLRALRPLGRLWPDRPA